jgi:hypothetical protein
MITVLDGRHGSAAYRRVAVREAVEADAARRRRGSFWHVGHQ